MSQLKKDFWKTIVQNYKSKVISREHFLELCRKNNFNPLALILNWK